MKVEVMIFHITPRRTMAVLQPTLQQKLPQYLPTMAAKALQTPARLVLAVPVAPQH
jgi:hypothetical protein